LAAKLSIDPSVTYRRLGPQGVVLRRTTGAVTLLSPVAAFLWESMGAGATAFRLTGLLTENYDVSDERAAADVLSLLREWTSRRLIVTDGQPGPGPERPADPRERDLLTRLAAGLAVPVTCDWEITRDCNLRCLHCYVEAGRPLAGELTTSQALEVLGQLRSMGCLFLTLTGGEPLVRADLAEIVRAAAGEGLRVTLLTNGSLAGPSRARELAEAGLGACEISLYGRRPETHDSVTGVVGSFADGLSGLEAFVQAGLRVTVKFPVMRDTFEERFEVKKLAADRGAGFALAPLLSPTLRGGLGPCDLRVSDRQLTQLLAEGLYDPRPVLCEPATHKLRLGSDGTMFACDYLPIPIGRLPTSASPLDLWQSPAAAALRRAPWTTTPAAVCCECPLRSRCPRCPGLAQLEHGSYDAVHAEACRIARAFHSLAKGGVVHGL
jgi:MoaA/NifB/PqqE/SkfB family radical SAM enzyme